MFVFNTSQRIMGRPCVYLVYKNKIEYKEKLLIKIRDERIDKDDGNRSSKIKTVFISLILHY